jgi:hypothetical protein
MLDRFLHRDRANLVRNRADLVCRGLLSMLALAALLGFVPEVHAQLPTPQLLAIAPTGAQQGTTVEVRLAAGVDLEGADRLLFSHPGITAQPKRNASLSEDQPGLRVPGVFVVSIAHDVPPGVYDVCAAGPIGVSNPRAFAVGTWREMPEEPGNDAPERAMRVPLESVVNGLAGGNVPHWFRFIAARGQRVVIDIWAQRVDSRMDATLVVSDATGRELARNRDYTGRDPLVDLEIPADGQYTVMVYDCVYRGGDDYPYRLVVSTTPHLDFALPPSVKPGAPATATLFGRALPQAIHAPNVRVNGRSLDRLDVTVAFPPNQGPDQMVWHGYAPARQMLLDGFEYRLADSQGLTPPLFFGCATGDVVLEQEPNDEPAQAQSVRPPCEVVGQFDPRGDLDGLRFEAKQGQVYWLEVFSHRLGCQTDPTIVVQRLSTDAEGKLQTIDLLEADDAPKPAGGPILALRSNDPLVRFEAPADGTYRVAVADLYQSASDPRCLYRLSIREASPDFRLAAVSVYPDIKEDIRPWSTVVARGGTATLDVFAERRDGLNEPIELRVEGLPAGVTCAETVLAANQDRATLVIQASSQAAAWAGPVRVVGRATRDDEVVEHDARTGTIVWANVFMQKVPAESRRAQQLMLAVVEDAVPVRIELGNTTQTKVIDTRELRAGDKVSIPVRVTGRESVHQPLVLTPANLPPGLSIEPLTLAPEAAEGTLVLQAAADVTPGQYTFNVRSPARFDYRRGEALVRAATDEVKRLEQLADELAHQRDANRQPSVERAAKAVADVLSEARKQADIATKGAERREVSTLLDSTPIRVAILPAGQRSAP